LDGIAPGILHRVAIERNPNSYEIPAVRIFIPDLPRMKGKRPTANFGILTVMPSADSRPLIEFRDVSYRVAGTDVLSGFNLEVQSGETVVLLGRSGSGKTSTLKLINRLLSPTSGEVRVKGVPTTQSDVIRLRRGIGYVIQEVGLFPHFTWSGTSAWYRESKDGPLSEFARG